MPIILTTLTFLSTLIGGLVGIKFRDHLHSILGFTAGVLLAVVAFDIFPEIFRLVSELGTTIINPMIALVVGFLVFHIFEKVILIHASSEESYTDHKHPTVGIASGLALSGHSLLDGVGIGLAFQISPSLGLLVAIAVIAHDFSDGLNTVTLMLVNKNTSRRAIYLLMLDAIAPVIGAISTLFFTLPPNITLIYLGFFAGFLLYIGASDILPEAHHDHPSISTLGMTILGVVLIFIVTRLI